MKISTLLWRLVLVITGSFCLLSCSGGGGGGGGGDSDITVGLTTAGGATTVPSGATLGIKANVTNTSSNMDVSWALSGPNCPNNCGTITRISVDLATYTAPSNVAAPFTVTVTATSVENPMKKGSVQLTVMAKICTSNANMLSGQYAFLLQGFDQATYVGYATAGSVTVDGCGMISSGELDYYFGPALAGYATTVSGSYSIGNDHRGTLSLMVNGVTKNFALALGKISGGIAHKGALTGLDTGGGPGAMVLSGSIWLQDPTAFALNKIVGPYAFLFNGWNASVSYGPREAMGGTVTADGAGKFISGLLDDLVFRASVIAGTPWTGTYGIPSTSGRSILNASALTGSNGTAVIYVVDSTQIIVMISDVTSTGRVFSGVMLAQKGTFNLSSLNGNLVTYQTANYTPLNYEILTTTIIGMDLADGAGKLTISAYDQNAGGNISSGSGIQYTYSVASNGVATIYTPFPTVGGRWYLTGPNAGLMLGFDPGVSVGMIMPQSTGPFSAGSINGNYVAIQAPGGSYGSITVSGVADSVGNGAVSTTMDSSRLGFVLTGQTENLSFTFSPNGRAVDVQGAKIIYVVSPDSFLMLDTNSNSFYPVIQLFER